MDLTFLVCRDDSQIDVPVRLFWRQVGELLGVIVIVYGVGSIHARGVVGQYTYSVQ